jgi:hypothetical protein
MLRPYFKNFIVRGINYKELTPWEGLIPSCGIEESIPQKSAAVGRRGVERRRNQFEFNNVTTRKPVQLCVADFSLLNLPKGKSLGRSKPATNS